MKVKMETYENMVKLDLEVMMEIHVKKVMMVKLNLEVIKVKLVKNAIMVKLDIEVLQEL